MSWRFHGRADVNPIDPHAFAICDRCGFLYNHVQLRWQFQWVGPQLQNLRILVCQRCMDQPQEQLRTVILPPDPLPIWNARPPYNDQAEIDYIVTQSGQRLTTSDTGQQIVKSSQTTVGSYSQ